MNRAVPVCVNLNTPCCYDCIAAPQESSVKVEVHHTYWQELLLTLVLGPQRAATSLEEEEEEMLKHRSSVFVHAAADVAGVDALTHTLLVCRRGDS